MLKLIKYELRKQIFSKLLILIAVAVLQVIFLYGLFTEKESVLGISGGLFAMLCFVAILFVSFECIYTFSNDLKTKQSYMLFLTPNSTYSIVGAKVLSSMINIALTSVALVGITTLNILLVLAKNHELDQIVDFFQEAMQQLFQLDLNAGLILTVIASIICSWIATVIIGMASITLSATFLSNSKFKGVVSVIFFFGFNWLIGWISTKIPLGDMPLQSKYLCTCGYMAVIVVLFYFATAWMLDKKVSV